MLKKILFLLIVTIPYLSFSTGDKKCCSNSAKCTGKDPCLACSNCSSCQYCAGGGSCGACKKKNSSGVSKAKPTTNSQCRATTKKGTRCSRSANTSGYCWQHDK